MNERNVPSVQVHDDANVDVDADIVVVDGLILLLLRMILIFPQNQQPLERFKIGGKGSKVKVKII